MNARWAWIFGIASGVGLLLTIHLFLAAQDVTDRDLFVFGLGLIVGGMIAAFIATFVFHSKGREAKQAEEKFVAARRAELVRELPVRTEKLAQIREAIAQNRIDSGLAAGNRESLRMHAQSAHRSGFGDIAQDSLASAETWKTKHDHLAENLAELEVQQATLEAQTNDENLAEQKRLRGLD